MPALVNPERRRSRRFDFGDDVGIVARLSCHHERNVLPCGGGPAVPEPAYASTLLWIGRSVFNHVSATMWPSSPARYHGGNTPTTCAGDTSPGATSLRNSKLSVRAIISPPGSDSPLVRSNTRYGAS